MALARRRGNGFPPVIADPIGQTVANRGDGGLKTLKIAPGSQADDTPAIRTLIPLQPERLIIAVKIGPHKSVPPDPAPAPETLPRLFPGIAAL
jgi:hypothetical protein